MKEKILPKPQLKSNISLEETILKRYSVRRYKPDKLSNFQISQLLWVSYGEKPQHKGRTVPSAGGIYPMKIYAVLPEGVYTYLPEKHKLIIKIEKDVRKNLSNACWGQEFIYQVPLNIVISCIYKKIMKRYSERGIRYAHIEAGHIAQNIHLEAVVLGLGSVPVGAYDDLEVSKILELDKEETPLYIIPVGKS